jgi:hypothetical protein
MVIGKTINKWIYRAKEGRNILHAVKRKDNGFGNMLRTSCLLKQVVEGKIEGRRKVKARRRRRRRKLLDDLKKKRGS